MDFTAPPGRCVAVTAAFRRRSEAVGGEDVAEAAQPRAAWSKCSAMRQHFGSGGREHHDDMEGVRPFATRRLIEDSRSVLWRPRASRAHSLSLGSRAAARCHKLR